MKKGFIFILIFVLLFLSSCKKEVVGVNDGVLQIKISPISNLNVYKDNDYNSNIGTITQKNTIITLAPGTYTIGIGSLNSNAPTTTIINGYNYSFYEKENIKIESGKAKKLNVKLKPVSGILKIETNPSDANNLKVFAYKLKKDGNYDIELSLNNISNGISTNNYSQGIVKGSYKVKVENKIKIGGQYTYFNISQEGVKVDNGKETKIKFNVNPGGLNLYFKCLPGIDNCYLIKKNISVDDNAFFGEDPSQFSAGSKIYPLGEGQHKIKIKIGDYEGEKNVNIKADHNKSLDIKVI